MSALAPAAPRLAIVDARVAYDGVDALRGVSLDVRPGTVVGLVGPNGAGKSTLLRVAAGTLAPDAGEVRLDGLALDRVGRRDRARLLAVVQQIPEAPEAMRVADLVLLGRHPHIGLLARESARDRAIAHAAMERAGCAALADRAVGTLSGGQRRRAFIARALAQEPGVLLLDEPTANLDPGAQVEVFELVRDLAADGVAVLAVVHDLTLAAAYCDEIVLIAAGRVVAAGQPGAVLTDGIVRATYGDRVEVVADPRTGSPLVVPVRRREG